jgi:hypothetical protein
MTLTSKLEQPGRSPLVIIRVFRAQIHPGKEGEFERFVRETGVPPVQAQAGYSQMAWGRSRWSDQPEFAVVTHGTPLPRLRRLPGRAGSKPSSSRKSTCRPRSSAITTRPPKPAP